MIMKLRKIIIILLVLLIFSSHAEWFDSYEKALNSAKASGKPVLIYFYSDQNKECNDFDLIIKNGYIDFLNESFDFVKIDVGLKENVPIVQKFNIRQIPLFALDEQNPLRKKLITPVGIQPQNLFKGLFDIYREAGSIYFNSGKYDLSYDCLKLIKDLPGEFGTEVRRGMKEIEPKLSQNPNKEADKFKADSYMQTAKNSNKNKNYEKAYIYYGKVIELVPGTELAKEAKKERNSLKEKIDTSKILN